MNGIKRLPYGVSDFTDLRRQGMYYTDKTHYIPRMEEAGNFLFLIRPRRFGKSVFLSMLAAYYDLAKQDRFDQLFDGLLIKEHPTAEKGQYQVMHLDFSQATVGMSTSQPPPRRLRRTAGGQRPPNSCTTMPRTARWP